MTKKPLHTILRGGVYHYRRRIPQHLARLYPGQERIAQSLKTREPAIAALRASEITAELDRLWSEQDFNAEADAAETFDKIRKLARSRGFAYRSAEKLAADASDKEILRRVEMLMGVAPSPVDAKGNLVAPELTAALLGGGKEPDFTLSEALAWFQKNSRDATAHKSADQARRWWNAKARAWGYLTEAIGDTRLSELTRDDLLDFRDHLWALVDQGQLVASSANKQISHVKAVLNDIAAKRRLRIPELSGLKFKSAQKVTRAPWSVEFVQSVILAPGAFANLNEQARRIFFVTLETGARLSEIANLTPPDIQLDADIPHIKIQPREGRQLKNATSRRDLPLVGIALAAMKANPGGFPRYLDKSPSLSAILNKYLSDHDMRPEPGQSAYSARHTMQDRLIAAGALDRFQSEIMGHALGKETYGRGPGLEAKRELLEQIRFRFDPGSV